MKSNYDLPQSRSLLREGVRKGEEKYSASPKKENRGNGNDCTCTYLGEDYVAFLLAFLEELISYESPRRIKFCSTTCLILDRGEDQNVSDSHDARIEEATIATASGEGGLCRKEGVEETSWGSQRIFSAVRVIFSKRLDM